MVLTRVGVPVAAPVSIGSAPSPLTMASEDSSIVSVDSAGRLVGKRNGRTRVNTLHGEGSSLTVEVRVVRKLVLDPPHLELTPGTIAEVVSVDGETGERLDPDHVEWGVTSSARLSVERGQLRALAPGRAAAWARYGEATAMCDVVLREPGTRSLTVSPPRATLRVGEVVAFQAFGRDGPREVSWITTDRTVLSQVRKGLFRAAVAGRARVCVSAEPSNCSQIEVTR
jgi:hypothetical protein